jgi:peptidoglycan L-alanyl-D-glutamate endopeptidase CwlK
MPEFGHRSKQKLDTLHPDLQKILNEVVKTLDITIVSGRRTAQEQDELYEKGYSKLKFPESKHNTSPSQAVDVMIWNKSKPRIRWEDKNQIVYMMGYIKSVADRLGIKLRMGGDWDGNMIFNESFFDGAHIELVEVNDE